MIASASAAGCDRGSPDFEADQGPAPQVVWSSPQDGATGVALREFVRVQFDRFLRPETTSRQSICIQAGPSAPCEGAAIEYDPVDRVVVAKLNGPLLPTQRYTVRLIAPSASAPDQGIRAFDDAALAKDATFAFTTGDASAMPTLPMRTADFCGAAPAPNGAFMACAGCHNANPAAGTGLTQGGFAYGGALQLTGGGSGARSTVAALVTNATVAVETATAPDPTAPRRGGLSPFGQNMPYIDKGNPANSYLLYKLMVGGTQDNRADAIACLYDPREPALTGIDPCTPGRGGAEPWVPTASSKPPALGEHDRLWRRLKGNGMPGADIATVHTISAWIAAGATTPMTDCAP